MTNRIMDPVAKKKHEDFKSRLVNDVLGKDTKGKVPMEKVTMLIWQFRDDPSVVQFMAQFVAKFSGSRDVFDGIEFYLPQLAHMIIHLEAEWDDAILERFALVIAQQSIHFALQLNWILQGAIEDYQPETVEGTPNEGYNPLFYTRCVKLLSNIERCVVYGTPRTHELQRLYERGKITKKEYDILEQADRRYNAAQITRQDDGGGGAGGPKAFGGELLYKRRVRSSWYKPKPWKSRYFRIEERMLYCYNCEPPDGRLVRAMPLEGATVSDVTDGKYPFTFEVKNQGFDFRMRAKDDAEKGGWMETLKEESEPNALYTHIPRAHGRREEEEDDEEKELKSGPSQAQLRIIKDLSPSQRARYEFFTDERNYIRDVCDVAETLRFKDRDERKKLAPGLMKDLPIPTGAYLPLVNSTDVWRRVDRTIPKDTKVFNTKARCPVLMYFVTKRGERLHRHRGGMKDVNLDVAEYLHLQYEVPDEGETKSGGGGKKGMEMSAIGEGDEEAGDVEDDEEDEGEEKTPDGEDEGPAEEGSPIEEEEGAGVQVEADAEADAGVKGKKTIWKEESKAAVSPMKAKDREGSVPKGKGNRQVRKFMDENVVSMPRKLLDRIESRRSTVKMSILDTASGPFQSVPIVEKRSFEESDAASADGGGGGGSVVSGAGSSSILNKTGIVMVEEDGDDVDRACLDRAKAVVVGGETWAEKSARMLREATADEESTLESESIQTEIQGLMAKSNDDLRQEVFVMQMIHYYKSVFANAGLPLWLKTYRILSTSKDTGLIEIITDSTSIHGLKTADGFPAVGGLRAYFERVYGAPESKTFSAAQRNFMLSLCAYSLVSYLLGLKDRHNGNIMIDIRGRLIHIDFGFVMGMAPGHEWSMERAPFKLTRDYMDVMGGETSECFREYQRLFVAGFEAARANSQVALGLVEIMMYKSNYPCFTGARYGGGITLKRFEDRLLLRTPEKEVRKKALQLIQKSINHRGTRWYDKFQKWSNGYAI